MRVLCTCLPGYGHLHPMVPLALALEAAGHDVAFATEARFCERVTRAGFRAFPAGIGPGRVLQLALARPGLDPADTARFGAEMFAGVAAPAKLPDLLAALDAWRPHLILSDATDFAGPLAAASTGTPTAAHSLGPLFPAAFYRRAGELLDAPPLVGPYLDICPPSLQSPDVVELAPAAHLLRPVPFDAVAGEALPAWVDELPVRPTVYVTLGTLDNDAPEVFAAAVAGLRDEPLNVVVTVGPGGDPALLGPQPAHVRVERYVPQSLLFPRCDAVVAHGGSGTTLGALAHGLPLVLLPRGANQFENAERCAALGVGIRLLPDEVAPDRIRHAVRTLLDRPDYRHRAQTVAAEITAMPAPDEVVPLLERLAGQNG